MIRLFIITLQAAVLVFAGLFLSVAVAPFTPEGLVSVPSRIATGIFVLSKMPVDGAAFLGMLRSLAWAPFVTAMAALPQGIRPLRPLRWVGVAVNGAALGYLLNAFPALLSSRKVALPLAVAALLFLVSALLLIVMPQKAAAPVVRKATVPVLFFFWAGAAALLVHGALRQSLSPFAFGGVAASIGALALVFYCIAKAVSGLGSQGGVGPVYLLFPLAFLAACVFFSPPLALPVGAGLLFFLNACMG